MKYYYIIITFILFGFNAFGIEVNGKEVEERNLIYYYTGTDKTVSGKIIDLWPNGRKKIEISVKDGKINGYEIFWDENGNMVFSSIHVSNKTTDHYFWYSDGQLKAHMSFDVKNNKFIWDCWDENGNITKYEKLKVFPFEMLLPYTPYVKVGKIKDPSIDAIDSKKRPVP